MLFLKDGLEPIIHLKFRLMSIAVVNGGVAHEAGIAMAVMFVIC